MKTVLVIGSMNMDYTIYCSRFPNAGETLSAYERIVQPGGKGANQAAACAKSKGVHTLFFGACGSDSDGDMLLNSLGKAGVDCRVSRVNASTGNATIFVNEKGENEILIVAGANALAKDVPQELIEEADCLILQNEIPIKTNLDAVKKAKSLGKPIIYNPAPAAKAGEACIDLCDFLIVNETELASYSGTEDIDQGMDIMLSRGLPHIIVTLGEHGSRYKGKEGEYNVPAVKVDAVDTVGAGDTYVGYFASALMQGKLIPEAMEYASKASAIAVTRKGSIAAIPFGEELN